MANFESVESFRYWCHKVLPLVFDDSLSYYEQLCVIAHKLNIMIDNNNKLPEYLEELIVNYITGPLFAETLSKVLATYDAENSKINLGYREDTTVHTDTHIYETNKETITVSNHEG